MSGPSTQVTVHHRGAVASSPFYDDPVFHDQISAQEENLVHGFVPAENPEHHRWLFPTTEIMEDYCNHWQREWTQGCDSIFHNIAKGLERGTAKPLTQKGWKAYSRGQAKPTNLVSRQIMPLELRFFQILVRICEICRKTHLQSFSHE